MTDLRRAAVEERHESWSAHTCWESYASLSAQRWRTEWKNVFQPTSPNAELNAQWDSWAEGQLAERHDVEAVGSSSTLEAVSAVDSWESWTDPALAAVESEKLETPPGSNFNEG